MVAFFEAIGPHAKLSAQSTCPLNAFPGFASPVNFLIVEVNVTSPRD
jgi:hypothetical protein